MFRGVRIRRDQIEWLDRNNINVSSLVRDLLDDEIARREGKLAEASA